MRTLRCALVAIALIAAALTSASESLAQDGGTPAATPAASPVAADPLTARLGGPLDSFTTVYGAPDFSGDGLVRYDDLILNGVPTILVAYHDAAGQVTKLALVYRARPDSLSTPAAMLATAATVAPADGACQSTTISSGFGTEVYPCKSSALADAVTAQQLDTLGVTGAPGDYSIAVNPLPDAYFEIVVQLGTDGPSPVPTAVAGAPTAGPTPTLEQQYPEMEDPRTLMDGDVALDEPLSFTGEILTLQVAGFGKQFHLGQDDSLGVSSLFQVRVPIAGAGDDQVIFVGYNGDATTLAIGDQVTVYGTNYGMQCFENAMGDEVCQPLIAADQVVEP